MTEKNCDFNGKILSITNHGCDRESWNLFEYSVHDGEYLLWEGWIENPNAEISDFSSVDKKIIELNLLFKNLAYIDSNGYIKTKTQKPEDFIDWLIYNDEYGLRRKVNIDTIIIYDNSKSNDDSLVNVYDYRKENVFESLAFRKNSYGNVLKVDSKYSINILSQAYLKKQIEIIAYYKDNDESEIFKITINTSGTIRMPIKYIEETLLPGTLPDTEMIKINELKSKNSSNKGS